MARSEPCNSTSGQGQPAPVRRRRFPLVAEVLDPLLDVDALPAPLPFRRRGAASEPGEELLRRADLSARVPHPPREAPVGRHDDDLARRRRSRDLGDDRVVGAAAPVGRRTERLPRLEPRTPEGPSKKRIARARVDRSRSASSATSACRSSSVGRATAGRARSGCCRPGGTACVTTRPAPRARAGASAGRRARRAPRMTRRRSAIEQDEQGAEEDRREPRERRTRARPARRRTTSSASESANCANPRVAAVEVSRVVDLTRCVGERRDARPRARAPRAAGARTSRARPPASAGRRRPGAAASGPGPRGGRRWGSCRRRTRRGTGRRCAVRNAVARKKRRGGPGKLLREKPDEPVEEEQDRPGVRGPRRPTGRGPSGSRSTAVGRGGRGARGLRSLLAGSGRRRGVSLRGAGSRTSAGGGAAGRRPRARVREQLLGSPGTDRARRRAARTARPRRGRLCSSRARAASTE